MTTTIHNNMNRKFGEIWSRGYRDMLADRQRNRKTDIQSYSHAGYRNHPGSAWSSSPCVHLAFVPCIISVSTQKGMKTKLAPLRFMKELRKILRVSLAANKTNEWVLNKAGVQRILFDTVKAKESCILWSHYEETVPLLPHGVTIVC